MQNCVRASFVAAAIAAIAWAESSAQTYRWVDKDGAVHYTQVPPPPDAKNVQKKNLGSGTAPTPDLPYATQLAAKNSPVTLYTSPDCGALCDQARALLVKRAVPFRESSVNTQKDIDELKKISGKIEVPLLNSAGYASSGPKLPLETLRKTDSPAKPVEPGPNQPQQSPSAAGK
jgi:hypothetical protein